MALTARAQKAHDFLNGRPGITRIEGQNIRPIAGTNTPSEHSYGNAIDVYGSSDALAKWAAEMDKRRGEFDIKVLCYDPGIGRKYDHCTTKHTDHLHLDFGPHCGGAIPATGSANELVTRCNDYQLGKAGTPEGPRSILDGLDIMGTVESLFTRGAIIAIGAVLGILGVVLIVKDTELGKAAIGAVGGAVKTATTKGIVK